MHWGRQKRTFERERIGLITCYIFFILDSFLNVPWQFSYRPKIIAATKTATNFVEPCSEIIVPLYRLVQ